MNKNKAHSMQKIVVKMMVLKTLFLSLMLPSPSFAVSNHLDAHVHGVSEMTIAFESKTVEIEMISPAMNLVGFEHLAESPEEIAIVEQTLRILQTPDELFSFTGGRCVLVSQTIDSDGMIETNEHEHVHKHEDSHAHESKHEHEKSEHNDVIASYRYRCEESHSLSSITVNLFDFFNGLHEINTMWITETQQGAITLNVKQKQINFTSER
jgi:hypothetical protein